jgi:PAS domain S-box-containing protein
MYEEARNPRAHTAFDPMHLCRFYSTRSTQAMVAVEGSACTVRQVNAAFLRLAGTSRSKLMGVSFARAVPEGESNGCMSLLERVYTSGKSETLIEQQHGVTPNVYWSYAVWPIRGKDRKTVGVMLQVTDSSETAMFRKQAVTMNEALLRSGIRQHELIENTESLNIRLQSALKEKEYFIAMLSHELRTPLAPVLMGASMLLQDKSLGADTWSVLEMINRNITLESHLIDDLLDMTRMENGKLNLDRRPVDIRSLLERSVALCAEEIEAGRISITVECEPQPQMMDADDSRLLQVFSNLIRNAVKFTPPGGDIHIRSRTTENVCIVDVIDTGAGIDAEFLPHVFDAFAQGHESRTRRGGLGLGLAICKMIVELHGGSIAAYSGGKDRGSMFRVSLPKTAGVDAEVMQKAPAATHVPAMIKPLRILLVEDHADTARIMSRVLKSEGHSVLVAGDVAGALAMAASNELDLLLSDIGLPDGNGWDLMIALRNRGSTLPGIALTGWGQDHDVQRSHRAGFSTHLTKPLSLQTLHDAISCLHE